MIECWGLESYRLSNFTPECWAMGAWEEFPCSYRASGDIRLNKKGPQYPHFRRKRVPHCCHTAWMEPLLPTVPNSCPPLSKPQRFDTEAWSRETLGVYGDSGNSQELKRLCKEGRLKKALDVLAVMGQQGVVPSVKAFRKLLHVCMRKEAWAEAKVVHSHIARHGLESNMVLGELLVDVLVKSGSLSDAYRLFSKLLHRTARSWTAVITGYSISGQAEKALSLYWAMQEEGVKANEYTFISVLKACGRLANLKEGKRIHAEVVRCGCDSNIFVCTAVLDMYTRCGSMGEARQVFDSFGEHDVALWNAMIRGYSHAGQNVTALQLYFKMQEDGLRPDDRTYVSVLNACASLAGLERVTAINGQQIKIDWLQRAKTIHAEVAQAGYASDVFVQNALIDLYAKCRNMEDARHVFDCLDRHDVVSWTAIISGYVHEAQPLQALQLYAQMQEEGVRPDDRTIVSTVTACASLSSFDTEQIISGQSVKVFSLHQGQKLHADAVTLGLESDRFVGSALVHMYSSCGSTVHARQVFDRLSQADVVTWTALISGYAQQGQPEAALQFYAKMQEEGVSPDDRTLVIVLNACASLAVLEASTEIYSGSIRALSLEQGKAIHSEVLKQGFEFDVFIGSALIHMYTACGSIGDAWDVFASMVQRDVVVWNAMLAGYVQLRHAEEALNLYNRMLEDGVSPDDRTFVSVLAACATLAETEAAILNNGHWVKVSSLQKGRTIHLQVRDSGHELNPYVGSSLVHMYMSCGSIPDAQQQFDRLSDRDVVAWTTMIAGYARQDQGDKAWQLYTIMQEDGVPPNEVTYLSILQACCNKGALNMCRQVHSDILNSGLHFTCSVTNTLIHAYGKCGHMLDARAVFDSAPRRDVVTWNALISGYAREGQWAATLQCFQEMKQAGTKPNGVTFVSLLLACSHTGMVDEGLEYFKSMARVYGIAPSMEHYVCVVDLLGRAGLLSEAKGLLLTMPVQPDAAAWLSLLAACRKHMDVGLGRHAFDAAVHLDSKQAAAYGLMSSLYAYAQMWEDANEIEEQRAKAGAWKRPAHTCIEHQQQMHVFAAGQQSQLRDPTLLSTLKELSLRIQCL